MEKRYFNVTVGSANLDRARTTLKALPLRIAFSEYTEGSTMYSFMVHTVLAPEVLHDTLDAAGVWSTVD